ncbi:nitrile hydratase subunit alpha [Gordonia polyisoprenivorans]|uniref:nitrile hydratase subunit alpha n=1 Tax=Gordonia polyisoprenivorans TaxID=84595 RepID=UPI001AD6222E|nr:nitrile hydratase subunit alpha [Gordonia polyisoprenivorans]QTI69083.1 nitrile hydratase subunit alpha [Gordonia polyisoprenivorans]
MSLTIDHAHDTELTHAPGVPAQAPAGDRAWALYNALNSKGLVPEGYVENWKKTFEEDFTPRRGAALVARAWTDPEFRELLLTDGTAAVGQYGWLGAQGEYIVAVEDTPTLKNVIVCSLCSCTAWPILGLPPTWYKSFEYRARVIREPRTVLAELGTVLPDDVKIRVVETSAETRYLVLPMRPAGTEGWSAEQLEKIVTKDCLIGVALPTVS